MNRFQRSELLWPATAVLAVLMVIAAPMGADAAYQGSSHKAARVVRHVFHLRPGGPDDDKLIREVYDAHALIHESDEGPLGTVLRRSEALLDTLALDAPADDLAKLREASAPTLGDHRCHRGSGRRAAP